MSNPLGPGYRFSHYECGEKLGEGGMGVVYRGRDLQLARTVAIKVLHSEIGCNPQSQERFQQEALTASSLNHPNIVTIYELVTDGPSPIIVMEYVEGEPLDRLIGSRRLDLKQALHIAIQVAGGLAKAHAAGVIHRDLKPANVLVTEDGLAKILDFGIAKLCEPSAPAPDAATLVARPNPTAGGAVIGTAAYMSPERRKASVSMPAPISFPSARCSTRWRRGSRHFGENR